MIQRTDKYIKTAWFYVPHDVPERFAEFHARLRRVDRLYGAAFDEYLAYWKDSNAIHIESGSAALNQARRAANDAMEELNRIQAIPSVRTTVRDD